MNLEMLLDKPKEDSGINVNNGEMDFIGILNRIETLEKATIESNKRLEYLEKMGEGLSKKIDEDINIDEDNNANVSTPQNKEEE